MLWRLHVGDSRHEASSSSPSSRRQALATREGTPLMDSQAAGRRVAIGGLSIRGSASWEEAGANRKRKREFLQR